MPIIWQLQMKRSKMQKHKHLLLLVALYVGLFAVSSHAARANQAPPQATSNGYTVNTFSTQFTPSTVDLLGLGVKGYSWYPHNYLGQKASASKIAVDENTKTLVLNGDKDIGNSQLATVTISKSNPDKFIGTAFGGGGYFEAELSFDPDQVISTGPKAEWPAFYGLSVERVAQAGADHWSGQPSGYVHYIEVDFFEYGVAFNGNAKNFYGTDLHDWYGIEKSTCPKFLCNYARPRADSKSEVPKKTDFSKYHKYGFLWVPATDTRQGLAQYYFDALPIGKPVLWNKMPDDAAPTPDGKPWAFSILDKQHLILILGTGYEQLMKVKSVNVWQSSDDNNLKR